MEDMCVRCNVLLQINKVLWPQKDSLPLSLKGGPVYVQVCLLGQLLQTELFPPVFPLLVNNTLAFDRVFTNCKVPSLLPEVLRGERVKIELIQVSEECNGGKVLGRYETAACTFLYQDKNGCNPFQIIMQKSHHYETSPLIQLSFCMSLLEARVTSPLKVFAQPFSVSKSASKTPSQAPPTSTAPAPPIYSTPARSHQTPPMMVPPSLFQSSPQSKGRLSFDTDVHESPLLLGNSTNQKKSHDHTSQSRDHSSLSHDHSSPSHDHSSPSHDHSLPSHDQRSHVSHKQLENSLSIDEFHTSELLERLRRSHEESPHAKYKSHDTSRDSSFMFSDHSWEECPRRHVTSKADDATNQIKVRTKPFVVPHTDPSLLSKREFCSCSPHKKATPTGKRPRFSSTPIKEHMISKYLGDRRGNQKDVTKRVQDKLQEMMKELSGKEAEGHSIVEDDTLRDSLAAKREESLSASRCPPTHDNTSLLTKLGYREYWSNKGSQYTGKSHRMVFDETLEKIYNRLYQNS